jgi:hypothetical protein
MKNFPFDIQQDLKLIKEFNRFLPLEKQFPDVLTNVLHRHDYLAKVVDEDLKNPADWRCYVFYPELPSPIAVFSPLTLHEALFIYRGDFYHDVEEKLNVFSVVLLHENKVAGAWKVCPEFMALILTRYADKNVLEYSGIIEEIGCETEFIEDYLDDLKNAVSKPRKPIKFLDLNKLDE